MAQPAKQELCSEIFKATQDIAAQAALRAQERLQKVREPPPPLPPNSGITGEVPAIPARSSAISQKAPDIPPKKFATGHSAGPPPLPQKPQSVRNTSVTHNENNNNGLYAQTQPPPPFTFPEVPKRQDFLPQVPSRPADNNNTKPAGLQLGGKNGQLDMKPNVKPVASKLNQLSPTEDTSSVDALRGIESGLRNMERAMQEQLTLRSMEATTAEVSKYNASDFRAGLRNMGSMSSFEQLQPPQYMINNNNINGNSHNNNNINNNSINANGNGAGRPFGLERGMSMDQMRLDNQMRSLESNPNIRSAAAEELKGKPSEGLGGKPRPLEQHMRSLDRSLPLELQYSRNHRQQQLQQQQQQLLLQQQLVTKVMNAPDPNRHMDMLNQFIQQRTANSAMGAINPGVVVVAAGGGAVPVPSNLIGRDDMKLRRRSSHDENQILQNAPPSAPGTNI